MIAGLRRNIDYEEAMQLVDKGDFILGGLEYPALKMVRNPLLQRMTEGIETTHTKQQLGIMEENERIQNIQRISVDTGVTRQDLQAVLESIGRSEASQQPDVDMGPSQRDIAQEASNVALHAKMHEILEEQKMANRQTKVANELHTKLHQENAKDIKQELIRTIHEHHVNPFIEKRPPQDPDASALIQMMQNTLAHSNNNIEEVSKQMNMSIAEITELLKQHTQQNVQKSFTPIINNHHHQNIYNAISQQYTPVTQQYNPTQTTQNYNPTVQYFDMTPRDSGARGSTDVAPLPPRQRSRSQDKERIPVPKPKKEKQLAIEDQDTPVMPPKQQQKPQRAESMEVIPVMSKTKPRASSTETRYYPSRGRSRHDDETPVAGSTGQVHETPESMAPERSRQVRSRDPR